MALLAARGFEVVASTGRAEEHGAGLRALGATEVIGRLEASDKALQSQRWAGVVDTVGGSTLAAAITQTAYRGAVASTGNAGGPEFSSTVFPFILRGVRLLGVDSTMPWNLSGYPKDEERWRGWQRERQELWQTMADCLSPEAIAAVHTDTIGLREVAGHAERILAGRVAGRVVVDVNQV